MHAKGHLCEAAFKAHEKGGLHKVVTAVMNRPKLTEEAFKKKRKFQEQNLQHIQEAVTDASSAYGVAAVIEFRGWLYKRWISYPVDKSYPMDKSPIRWIAICRIKVCCMKHEWQGE